MKTMPTLPSSMDATRPPEPLVPPEQWPDFCDWVRDGGYDESWLNRWDSRSLWLQEQYLEEMRDADPQSSDAC